MKNMKSRIIMFKEHYIGEELLVAGLLDDISDKQKRILALTALDIKDSTRQISQSKILPFIYLCIGNSRYTVRRNILQSANFLILFKQR
jgi:hypothetical protein